MCESTGLTKPDRRSQGELGPILCAASAVPPVVSHGGGLADGAAVSLLARALVPRTTAGLLSQPAASREGRRRPGALLADLRLPGQLGLRMHP